MLNEITKTYYSHSGRSTPWGIALGILTGLVFAAPAAFAYDYGIINIPEAKLRFVCTVAFGSLMGASAGYAMKLGRVRNNIIAGLLGTVTSLFALYVSWGIWLISVLDPYYRLPVRIVVVRPTSLWRAAVWINARGTWSISGSQLNGLSLWIVWTVEAIAVAGFGALAAVAIIRRLPFCEACDIWGSKKLSLYCKPILDTKLVRTSLENRDFEFLKKIVPGDRKRAHYRIDLHHCGSCGSLNTLTLIKNFPKDRKVIVRKLILSSPDADLVSSMRATVEHAMPPTVQTLS